MINLKVLAQRDKTMLLVGGCVLVVVLLTGGLMTVRATLGKLDRTIVKRSQDLRAFGELRREALDLQQKIRQAEEKLAKTTGASPATVAEGLVNRIAGKGNLAYLRPLSTATRDDLQIEPLEVKVERQPLEQILRLFWEIDNAAIPMHVTGLRLQRRFDNHTLLDATLTITLYRK